jgi:hypothetical protein
VRSGQHPSGVFFDVAGLLDTPINGPLSFVGQIKVDAHAPIGPVGPLVLFWTVNDDPASIDAGADGLEGKITFNVEVVDIPLDNAVYSSGILGPSTVTGVAQVGLQSDGLLGFRGHVREDGAIGHNYLLLGTLKPKVLHQRNSP